MSRITGWLARHTPQGPVGRQAALIDIAQDLLLARLCGRGVFDHLAFKGGTALRKVRYETPFGGVGNLTTKLDATEQRIVAGGAGSRNLVLEAIGSLPGSRFTNRPLY